MGHPLDPVPDPFPAVKLIETKNECLATALKACLALIEFDDGLTVLASRQEVLAEAIVYARKAVELGSKLNDV